MNEKKQLGLGADVQGGAMRTQFTTWEKAEIVEMFKDGDEVAEIANCFGTFTFTIERIIRQALKKQGKP